MSADRDDAAWRGDADTSLPVRAERSRIILCFALFGVGVVAVGVRLFDLQILRHHDARRSVDHKLTRPEPLPARRCRIADRDGALLAHDRRVFSVRGETYLRADATATGLAGPERLDRMVSDLAAALRLDLGAREKFAAGGGALNVLHERLADRLPRQLARLRRDVAAAKARGDRSVPKDVRINFPVHDALSDAAAIGALRELDRRTARSGRKLPYALFLHFERRHERVYSAPDLTAGVVGRVRAVFDDSGVDRIGASGLERLSIARSGDDGVRRTRVNARGVPYWTSHSHPPDAPMTLHTTLDLELQRLAQRHLLDVAVQSVIDKYGAPPEWGAMIAVDVPTGGVLAMASFLQDPLEKTRVAHLPTGAFVPTQFVFEPGSVVKPLVFALGLQRQQIDWSKRVDCASGTLPMGGARVRRRIYDSHPCGLLTPRGVLINSSNIGAVKFAMALGAEGLEDYLRLFGLRTTVDLPIPERRNRIVPPRPIPQLHRREREIYTAPSLCFGYGAQVNVAHVARAYLTFLSGRRRELRLIDAIEAQDRDGVTRRRAVPVSDEGSPRFLSRTVVGQVKEALVAMVDGAEGATAPRLTQMLRRLGVPASRIGGKTGTSEYPPGVPSEQKRRTASFVGFAPAAEPQILVVCYLQKTGARSFYGGSYAAPAVGRLLLDALERRRHRASSRRQVSALRDPTTERGLSVSTQKGR